MSFKKYRNREAAGVQLADLLSPYCSLSNLVLLALPRGGIPIANPIAKKLRIKIYPYIVRKLGVPGQSELAMGALAVNGRAIFNESIISEMCISKEAINAAVQSEKLEIDRREKVYLGGQLLPALSLKTVIIVDDGIATGATIKAAIASIKALTPTKIIVAVPVCPNNMVDEMHILVDDFICPLCPDNFNAVSEWYDEFDAVEDETVRMMIRDCDNESQ